MLFSAVISFHLITWNVRSIFRRNATRILKLQTTATFHVFRGLPRGLQRHAKSILDTHRRKYISCLPTEKYIHYEYIISILESEAFNDVSRVNVWKKKRKQKTHRSCLLDCDGGNTSERGLNSQGRRMMMSGFSAQTKLKRKIINFHQRKVDGWISRGTVNTNINKRKESRTIAKH